MTQSEVDKEKLQSQMDEWNKEIDKLKAMARESSAQIDVSALKEHIKELSKKRDEAKVKLDELYQETAEEALDDIKQGAINAFDSLKEAFKKGWSRF